MEEEKMDLEKLIHQHNKLLEQKVEENVFLNQRIKARLKDHGKIKYKSKIGFRKKALLYSFLFVIFTFINLVAIGMIMKKASPRQPEYIVKMDAFQVNYTGSISKVYQEVLNWEN
jgi:hypothetical protein